MSLIRAVLGVLLMAVLATVVLVLLAVTRRPGFVMRVVAPRWGRWICAVVGIRLQVEGQEHLAQPAVIVANHQSLLEAFIIPAVVPPRLRIVGKREVRHIPFFGWAFSATGQILIDRSDPASARATIDAALKKLPPGVSVYIAPEGTRSQDGTLLPFKKGAFHIAMQLKRPIVPLTLDGAYKLLPKHSFSLKPGTVYVRISPPIDTTSWSVEHLEEHMAQVRGVMLRDLEALRAAHPPQT